MPSDHKRLDILNMNRPVFGASALKARLWAYLRLAFGIALVALFMSAATFLNARFPGLQTLAERIDTYGLRPSAIYYTDYEASGDAAALIRSSLEYCPNRPSKPVTHEPSSDSDR